MFILLLICIITFNPAISYSESTCEKPEIAISDSSLNFICDKKLSIQGIDFYRAKEAKHIVMMLNLNYSKLVPVVPFLSPINGAIKIQCSLPTKEVGLDDICGMQKMSIRDFYRLSMAMNNEVFAVINGSFFDEYPEKGDGSEYREEYLKTSYLYKAYNSIISRGSSMSDAQAKKALVLNEGSANIVNVEARSDLSEKKYILSIVNKYPSEHFVTGLSVNADKKKDCRIGRTFIGIDGKKMVILVAYDNEWSQIKCKAGSDSGVGLTQKEAMNVLKAFNIKEESMIMFDGSGSSQAIVNGELMLNGDDRQLNSAFAIYPKGSGCNSYFFDVTRDDDLYPYIKDLSSKCIVSGYGNSRYFYQGKHVTRGQFLKMLILTAKKKCGETGNQCTKDVPYNDMQTQEMKNDWSYKYVKAAYNLDLIVYDDEHLTFDPLGEIDRGQAVEILVRYLAGDKKENPEYSDSTPFQFQDLLQYQDSQIKPRFYKYAYAAKSIYHLIDGYTKGKDCNDNNANVKYSFFCPKNTITRGEVAKIIDRAFFPEVAKLIDSAK